MVAVFSKKKNRERRKKMDPKYDVMTLKQECPQVPHSDQQRQRGGHSRVDGADDFSNVRHNSTRFLLGPGYKARNVSNPCSKGILRQRLTLPGQSKHLIRHSGVLVALTLRKITSNLSLGYLACITCTALANHGGG
jgi:hypothetical protein